MKWLVIALVALCGCSDHPDGWEGREWSKHEHDKEFGYYDVMECGKWIEWDMMRQIEAWQKEEGRKPVEEE